MIGDWKYDDLAMIKIARMSGADVEVRCSSGIHYCLPISALRPIPPAMTPEERAVIDAADVLVATSTPGTYNALVEAWRALRASRDPDAALRAAYAAWDALPEGPERDAARARIAAAVA